MKPLVSVIIPAFNRADYINQTVRSVLEQTYPNVELIVVDDGSSDGTYEMLQAFGGRLQLLTHAGHVNKGQSASINLGLDRARGEYIAILDSDDYWSHNKLELQVDYLENHSNIGLIYSNGYCVDLDGNIIYSFHRKNHKETNDPSRLLMDCYLLLPQSALVRKSVYDQVGKFEERYRAAQDHDMLIRIAEITQFAYIPDYLFFYRRHGNSISSKNQYDRWKNGFHILAAARQRYPYKPLVIRKRRAVLHYRLGICHLSERKLVKFAGHMFMSLILDPIRALKVVIGLEKCDK